jgi:ADP-heptose:LPS heptosyltransferase
MPSVRFLARRLADKVFGTAFDRALVRARRSVPNRFLFFWNRGLGDIALGLVPLFLRVRREFPGSRIEVITRADLRAPFELAAVDAVHVIPDLQREARIDMAQASMALGLVLDDYAAVFDYPDPNRWLAGRRRDFPPRLSWAPAWDSAAERFREVKSDRLVIGAHVRAETGAYYGYVKDWPEDGWRALLARFPDPSVQWVLFGLEAQPPFEGENVVDLRGRTRFAEAMSLVRNRCRVLIAPDSGILTMTYYLEADFPIEVISLWSDPRQGVLLQGCPSPNPRLVHTPLLSPGEDLSRLEVNTVADALNRAIASSRTPL